MSKSRNKQARPINPAIRLSALRPRLDQLFHSELIATPESAALRQQLDQLVEGIKPDAFVPVLLAAADSASDEAQPVLNAALPGWLQQRNLTGTLERLLAQAALRDEQRRLAVEWLATAGVAANEALVQPDLFYTAYYAGNDMQGTLMFFWYDSPRRNRATGLGLLLDYNPPWEGAVKDAISYPKRTPEALIETFVGMWRSRGLTPQQLSAAEAKRQALVALAQNQQQNIGLHRDLISARTDFIRQILTLPDLPDTPAFSVEDFDTLVRSGRRPEALQLQERTMGYQTRMPDGKILHIMRPPDDDEDLY